MASTSRIDTEDQQDTTVKCLLCWRKIEAHAISLHLSQCYAGLVKGLERLGAASAVCPLCCKTFGANLLAAHIDGCAAKSVATHMQNRQQHLPQQQQQPEEMEEEEEEEEEEQERTYTPHTPPGSPPPLPKDENMSTDDETTVETIFSTKGETNNDDENEYYETDSDTTELTDKTVMDWIDLQNIKMLRKIVNRAQTNILLAELKEEINKNRKLKANDMTDVNE